MANKVNKEAVVEPTLDPAPPALPDESLLDPIAPAIDGVDDSVIDDGTILDTSEVDDSVDDSADEQSEGTSDTEQEDIEIDTLSDEDKLDLFNEIPDHLDDEFLGKIQILKISGADKENHVNHDLYLAAKNYQIAVVLKATINKVTEVMPQTLVNAIAESYAYGLNLKSQILEIQ